MAGFDPDAYLAQKPFNPDEYLGAEKKTGVLQNLGNVAAGARSLCGCHGFLSLMIALSMTRSLRAMAMSATIFGFPFSTSAL